MPYPADEPPQKYPVRPHQFQDGNLLRSPIFSLVYYIIIIYSKYFMRTVEDLYMAFLSELTPAFCYSYKSTPQPFHGSPNLGFYKSYEHR
jgi:hypothetical protein